MKYSRLISLTSVLISTFGWQIANANSCDSPEPDWILCEDFEAGNLSKWDASTLDQYHTIMQGPGPSGAQDNHVFRLRVPPERGGEQIVKTFTPNEYDVLYARWYISYEAGFDFAALNHGHGFHAGDRWKKGVSGSRPLGDDWFTASVEYEPITGSRPQPRPYIYAYYRGMSMDCSNPDGACWGDHIPCMISSLYCDRAPSLRVTTYPPPLEHEKWYCVEMMINAGDPVSSQAQASGVMNLWVDGAEIGPWQNMWFRTSSSVRTNLFWLGLFHHGVHSVEGLKFDDVTVSTSRIGCHNSVRPNPPSSLRVN